MVPICTLTLPGAVKWVRLEGKLTIEVYNINGQLVAIPYNDDTEEGIWQGEFGRDLNPGFYLVRATMNGITHSLKVIKE